MPYIRSGLLLLTVAVGCGDTADPGAPADVEELSETAVPAGDIPASPMDSTLPDPPDDGPPPPLDAGDVAAPDEGASTPPEDFDHVWEIGPGQQYEDPSAAPWESLQPSTLVRIHARPTPYAHKWVINVAASEDRPVVVTGVPAADGTLPVITGDGATTRAELDYWNDERSVIKLGGSSVPDNEAPSWVTLQHLEVRSAHAGYGFTDDAGQPGSYAKNAAAIHIEKGAHLTIAGCTIHDSGNGVFAGHLASDIRVAHNHIFGNGNVGSAFEHNTYMSADGILYEGNHYGPLRAGADGNNLKDRSAGLVVRYNWIEGGNRQLDLVDSAELAADSAADYHVGFVYGNVLFETEGQGNSQIIHWGGDSDDPTAYHGGTLHLFHNTIVSTRSGNTTVLRLSSADGIADLRNNLIVATAGSGKLAISAGDGTIELRDNWFTGGWKKSHGTLTGDIILITGNSGPDPGFADLDGGDLVASEGVDKAGPLAEAAVDHPVTLQYVSHQATEPRPVVAAPDIGALEHPAPPTPDLSILTHGPWLMGWHGGLDHFSWVHFEQGPPAVVTFLDPTGGAALTPWLSCSGTGTWAILPGPASFELTFPPECVADPMQLEAKAVLELGDWPPGPVLSLHLVQIAPAPAPLSAYLYPEGWCDEPFTACDAPW